MSEEVEEKKRKRVKYEVKFSDGWLSNPLFKDFLQKKKDGDKYVPYCAKCKVNISLGKSAIVRHMECKSHQEAKKRFQEVGKSQSSIQSFCRSTSSDAISKMEIKLCSFLAENNLPLSLSDDLVALLKSLFPNDETLKGVTLGKQKATNTVRQTLGFYYMKENIDILKSRKFSIIIDETTDSSTQSQMAVLATYFDEINFRMSLIFVDLISMPDGKADTIYNTVLQCFKDKNIPMKNIIGFCADTCNVMFGAHHSVAQLLVKNHPWIITIKCSCHLIHLCASHASKILPKSIEDLCRNVYSYFRLSSQRCDAFKEFQDFLNLDQHQMLRAGQTRWLSMKMCVDRLLEQYEALKLYFRGAALEDPSHTNDAIAKSLNNVFTQAYLEFMSYNLGRLTSFNTLFQSEIPLLHQLKGEVTKLISGLIGDFMDLSYVRQMDPLKIDIQSRFSNLDQLDFLKCLEPRVANNLSIPSLGLIFKQLPYLDSVAAAQAADTEWREQAMLHPTLNETMSVYDYWKTLFQLKDGQGNVMFPNLRKIVSVLLPLPFSNAAVERVFSQLKLIKNDHRSCLKQESLLGLLVTKFSLKQQGKMQAAQMDPSKTMLQLHSKMKSNADDAEVAELRKTFLAQQESQ
ncbi:hypothetical protein HOLleu_12119 [Holothuria leucospilota]|uniref:HAT C-terminal dimerisation domain-containing protein n=1 Tax=Holothuria leucospilota TaxID=206669 RepID=A0A9Q1CB42_HOLLE|nr:hypothetical protein HOLleu_12119 [Holothuria leucospilota]